MTCENYCGVMRDALMTFRLLKITFMCISRFLATFAYFFALLANAADVDNFNLVK